MQQVLSYVFYIIVAIMALLFMVTIHEAGHYVAGKILKFKINEFSIGFGKSLFQRKNEVTGEVFSLRLIPLGGFCAFEGEDQEKEGIHAFNNQKPWKRIIVLLSGVAANFLFSLLLCIIIFSTAGMFFPKVIEVYPDDTVTVSDELKLNEGDLILAVEGKYLYLRYDLQDALKNVPQDREVRLTVVREGQRQDVNVIKRDYKYTDEEGKEHTATGLGISQGFDAYRLGFFEAVQKGIVYCFKMAGVILGFFGKLITGKVSLSSIGGPITTIGYTAEIASKGLHPLLEIVTLIGVNLAVFNVLPIPALDGSRIVFVIIEWIRKKPIKREIEGKIHLVGLIALFAFVILVDLLQLFQHF
jgi:regulator of sigma E protease